MSKTNVLVVARHLCGGIRTYIDYNYSPLRPADFGVTLLATEDGEFGFLAESLRHLQPKCVLSGRNHPVWQIARSVRRLLAGGGYDVIHAQGLTSGVASLAPAKAYRTPLIVTHHDVFLSDTFKGGKGLARKRLLEIALPGFDLLITVSEDSRRNLFESLSGVPVSRVSVRTIPNGVEVARYSEVRTNRVGQTPDSPFRLAFLGRFMPQKGFDVLIQAVDILQRDPKSRDRFIVEAVNEGAYVREYKAMIGALGVESRFRFFGLRPSVASVLSEVDAVVIPSRWEACPLLPMEAFAAGCPVICSDSIGLREVVVDTPALSSRSGDPASLAGAIRDFIAKAADHEKAAASYREAAGSRFDVRWRVAELTNLIREQTAS